MLTNGTVDLVDQLVHTFHDLAKAIMIDNVVDKFSVALGLYDTGPA
jgi:hypothetical protein